MKESNINLLKIKCKCDYCRFVYFPTYIYFWRKERVEALMSKEMRRLKAEFRLGKLDGFEKIHRGEDVPLKAYEDNETLRFWKMKILEKVVKNKDMETIKQIYENSTTTK